MMKQLAFANGTKALIALLLPFVLLVNYAFYTNNFTYLTVAFLVPILLMVAYVMIFHFASTIPWLLAFAPLSLSVSVGGGFAMAVPSEFLIGLTTIIFLASAFFTPVIRRDVLRHPVTIILLIELGWMLICSVTSNYPLVSVKRSLVRMSFISVFFLMAINFFEKKERRSYIWIVYALGCLYPIFWAISRHAQFGFRVDGAYAMCFPFFADHTIYGAVLIFIIPGLLILLLNRQLFNIKYYQWLGILVLLAIIVTAEVLSFSRAAWLSGVAVLLFYLLLRIRTKLWMLILALGILLGAAYTLQDEIIDTVRRNEAVSNSKEVSEHIQSVTNIQNDASNLERINRWVSATRMASVHPVFGFGPGTYQFEYGPYQSRAYMTRISTFNGNRGHAHSELFTALSETGYPGMIIFIISLFTMLGYGLRVVYRSQDKKEKLLATAALLGLVSYFVHGFFNAFLDTDKMASLVFASLAVIVITDVQQRKNKSSVQPSVQPQT